MSGAGWGRAGAKRRARSVDEPRPHSLPRGEEPPARTPYRWLRSSCPRSKDGRGRGVPRQERDHPWLVVGRRISGRVDHESKGSRDLDLIAGGHDLFAVDPGFRVRRIARFEGHRNLLPQDPRRVREHDQLGCEDADTLSGREQHIEVHRVQLPVRPLQPPGAVSPATAPDVARHETEAAAALEPVAILGLAPDTEIEAVMSLLDRLCAMLTRLAGMHRHQP